jgi:uncharacterized protein YciI
VPTLPPADQIRRATGNVTFKLQEPRCDVSKTLFLVFRNPGPSWVPGLSSREQPLWDEHALFMDRLFDKGRIVLGGPYADFSRVLLVVQARDKNEASELFRDDPWTSRSILVESEIIEWSIFLDFRLNSG